MNADHFFHVAYRKTSTGSEKLQLDVHLSSSSDVTVHRENQ